MDSINNYINNMNRSGGINSFGSVEDLIRTSLGGSFLENKKKEKEIPSQEDEIQSTLPDYSDEDDIINSSIQRLKNFDPSSYKKKTTDTFKVPSDSYTQKVTPDHREKEEPVQQKIPKRPENLSSKISNYYPFYRDIEEVFECKVTIEGTASNSIVRLLLETESWDIVFQGKIKKDGICSIPIKKLSLFPVGTIGKATLEVIVDDILFTPWENPFRIEESKKVEVEVFKRRPK
jgi:hypothetical protein